MSDYQEVEKIYGKHTIYSIQKRSSTFGSPKYYVLDANTGKVLGGSFDSISDAVAWARKQG
jgi:hypothetical protein